MNLQSLPQDVRNYLRSGININSPCQCVMELVLNSLDAKSTAIAVRVNLVTYRIQVVDNGKGISSVNMNNVGIRFMTSKCQSLEDLKNNTRRYGFRGEALASIAEVSGKLTISSRLKGTSSTYTKTFESGKIGSVFSVKERPEHGTTISVENFLQNMHVRQQRIKQDLDLDDIKQNMKYLAVIHPEVSFSLRNDVNGKMILRVNKTMSVSEAFVALFPDIDYESFSNLKVSKKHVHIDGLLYKKSHKNQHLQLIYVNKRPVVCREIQKQIKKLYLSACNTSKATGIMLNKSEHPVYILNIRCVHSNVDFTLHPSKTTVMFRKIDDLLECVQKIFRKFWEIEPSKCTKQEKVNRGPCIVKREYGVSVVGGIKSMPVKRKSSGSPDNEHKKLKIGEEPSQRNLSDDVLNFLQGEVEIPKLKNTAPDVFEDYQDQATDDQQQGKNLMMNKFFKSLETYKNNVDRTKSETLQLEISVEKADQNLFAAKKNHISIQIQTEKTVRKKQHRTNAYVGEHDQLVSKCVQTSFLDDSACPKVKNINKTSKCIQTSIAKPHQYENSNFNSRFDTGTNYNYNCENENLLSVSEYFQSNCNENNECQKETVFFGNEIQLFKKPQVANVFDETVDYLQGCNNSHNQREKHAPNNSNGRLYSKVNFTEIDNSIDALNLNETRKSTDMNLEDIANNYDDLEKLDLGFCCSPQGKRHKNDNRFEFTMKQPVVTPFFAKNASKEKQDKHLELFSNDDALNLHFNRDEPFEKTVVTNCKSFATFNSHLQNNEKFFAQPAVPNRKQFSNKQNLKKQSGKTMLNLSDITLSPIPKCQLQKCDQNKEENIHAKADRKRRGYLSLKKMCNQQKQSTNNQFYGIAPYTNDNQASCEQSADLNSNNSLSLGDQINKPPNIKSEPNNENLAMKPFSELLQSGHPYKSNNNRRKFHGFLLGGNEKCALQNNSSMVNEQLECTISTPRINESKRIAIDSINGDSLIIVDTDDEKTGIKDSIQMIDVSIDSLKEPGEPIIVSFDQVTTKSELHIELDVSKPKLEATKELEINKACVDFENTCIETDLSNQMLESVVHGNVWVKHTDNYGNTYYMNERTGMTTFVCPKEKDQFNFKKRLEFVPKGLSPLLNDIGRIEKELSPKSKKELQDSILQCYEKELETVKWQNYIKTDDHEAFFKEIYKMRIKQFDHFIPSVENVFKRKAFEINAKSYNKNIFSNMEVVGQVDNKFIAVLFHPQKHLVLFDQHAVDERVRVEDLFKEYRMVDVRGLSIYKSTPCDEKLPVTLNELDLEIVKNYKNIMENTGLKFECTENGIKIFEIPACIANKFNNIWHDKEQLTIKGLIKTLVFELIDSLKSTRGCVPSIPNIIKTVVNMEACRGAIKFGDKLNKEAIENLLKNLSKCELCFQCAHGRPTLTSLIDMRQNNGFVNKSKKKINLNVLKAK